jgi:protein-S-isoprenylcysteine O-methyltransferase Ste14
MPAAPSVISWMWLAFVACWLILAQFNKKASRSTPWSRAWAVRAAIIIGVLVLLWLRRRGAGGFAARTSRSLWLHHPGVAAQWTGVLLCLAGFSLAFWARAHLGRNWGMPMSLRQGHELVTSGPYAYVRHPIYSGIMLAMIGSAVALGVLWLALFALYFAYFLFSARTEEKMMLAQFPDAYPAYRRRTKMLIPRVL